MTEIKTNKLTKETGKENREGKMKEDVQMTDAENKTGAEAGTQPKKKNISAVFRPQNSKTGMVKPGSRPKPARQNTNKSQDAAKVPAKAADAQEKSTPVRTSAETQGAAETKAPERTTAQARPAAERREAPRQGGERRDGGSRYQGERRDGRSQGGERRDGGSRYQGNASRNGQSGGRYQDGARNGQGGRTQDGTRSNQGGRFQDGGTRGGQGGERRDGGNRYQGGTSRNGQGGTRGGQGGRFQDGGTRGGQSGRFQDGGARGGQGGRSAGIPKAPVESKPLEKESRKRTERGDRNRVEKGEKLERLEKNQNGRSQQKNGRKQSAPVKPPVPKQEKPEETIRTITIPEKLTIGELAEAMKVQPAQLVKKLFLQGTMVTVNQEIEFDKAEEIALEFNCICEKEVKVDVIEELLKEDEEDEKDLVARPPVVCVMGHVDHGKTSLLDAIRNTHVIDREAGGITQHIGAYVVSINGQKITFLDTPGHEAFTAMRMRGANATDIAILVVAADDGVMPQTIEAISHAKAAGIEIIVAINKIDKPSANIDRVKQELSEQGLIPEDWGGSTICVPVSAHSHEGIDNLLEMILLTAEVAELKANPNRRARGLVIEAELDKGKGPVATILVQKGTLHVGDPIAAGACHGKVRAMMDDKGRRVKEAGPSTPVEILGLSDVPNAGEIFMAMENEKEARNFAETFIREGRERLLEETKSRMSLDDLFSQIQAGNLKELNVIVKADVQGSVEAVKQSLLKLSNEEVIVKIIHGGVGAINESDVILASTSNAIIIGFNVRPDATAKATAERENVDVRLYRVIYDAIADVEAAMKGMLDPVYEEKVIGHAEVRQTFKASGVGTIAGSYVLDGVFQRGCKARITREGKMIYEGALASLKRFKDDVKEVKAGYECGLVFEKFNDIAEGDTVEAYIMVEVPR
ncbi:MAG: translation initiation factor IF-2 [Lachnospiraceae bacterium]